MNFGNDSKGLKQIHKKKTQDSPQFTVFVDR